MTTATPVFMLKGDSLLDFVNEKMPLVNRGELTRTEMIKDAGYVYDNGKAQYVDFYTELLNAQGVVPVLDRDVEDATYTSLSSDKQDLYDEVDERFGEKWSQEEVLEFLDELEDIGIETKADFEDAFYGVYDSEKEFAEEFCNEVESINSDSSYYFAIDWQRVWDHSLRYDFDTIEFNYDTYFFRNC